MSCHRPWDRDLMESMVTKAWVNTAYKSHREQVLFDRERAMLPATQERAQAEIAARNLDRINAEAHVRLINLLQQVHRVQVEVGMSRRLLWDRDMMESMVYKSWVNTAYQSHREQQEIAAEIAALNLDCTNPEAYGRLTNLLQQVRQLQEEIEENGRMVHRMRYTGRVDIGQATVPATTRAPSRFMRGCPKEGCRGFIRGNMVCGICETRCCRRCLEVLPAGVEGAENDENDAHTSEHRCKPEDVQTARMLRQETRPCPQCASPIFKIDGCDQMWCTACSTAFSWRTGEIETGRVHNPHFYEWMRQGGRMAREPGDIPCGGIPNIQTMRMWMVRGFLPMVTNNNTVRTYASFQDAIKAKPELRQIYDTHRNIVHIEHVLMPRYRPDPIDNMQLRVAFLVGDIDEARMRAQLQKKEKAFRKRHAIHSVLEIMTVAAGDIYRNHLAQGCTEEALTAMTDELNQLCIFGNEAMTRVRRIWDCKAPIFDMQWQQCRGDSKHITKK
jgi:hypothetical protein